MTRIIVSALLAGLVALGSGSGGVAREVCTLLADAPSRSVLYQHGDCQTQVTPASTFKTVLAAMAFDAGLITSAHAPVLAFKQGYADWGGAAWRQDTDPQMWMTHSTVWYSQRLAEGLGAERLAAYAEAFGFGNADFSGDRGKDNGLERAWISSSLRVSPLEQAGFVAALVENRLPISAAAQSGTRGIVQQASTVDGWEIFGKTGSAYPRLADGSLDRTRGWGWFVGWAQKDERRIVVVRLAQDERREAVSGGLRARDGVLKDWPGLIDAALRRAP